MPEIAFDEEFENGSLRRRVQRIVSDVEIERRDAPAELRQFVGMLIQWSIDAQEIADQPANVTQVQLKGLFNRQAVFFRRFRKLLIMQGLDE